ncbi:anti-sigma factor antagonist [Nonomuraea phyllanthi]|nr:anti-sigma factor antagonist [Nonomuraea phyllanthi]
MRDFQTAVIGPIGDCAVLRVAGEIDVETAPQLRQRLVDLAGKGVRHVIADLGQVEFLDSTGLGVLVGGLKRQRTQGGSLTLVTDAERILRIFRITGLVTVLPPHPSVSEAIAADPHWRQAVEAGAESVPEWCREHGLAS